MSLLERFKKLNKTLNRVTDGSDSVLKRFIETKFKSRVEEKKESIKVRVQQARLVRLNKKLNEIDKSLQSGTGLLFVDRYLEQRKKRIQERRDKLKKSKLLKPLFLIKDFSDTLESIEDGDFKLPELPLVAKIGVTAVVVNVMFDSVKTPSDGSYREYKVEKYEGKIVPFSFVTNIDVDFNPEFQGMQLYTQYRRPFYAPAGYDVNSYTRARDTELEKWAAATIVREGSVVSSRFGQRSKGLVAGASRFHMGMDFGAPEGRHIINLVKGKVITSKMQRDSKGNEAGYGNFVQVKDANGYVYTYAHMSKRLVSVGDEVEVGDVLGLVGNTGVHGGNHVHFDVHINGKYIPPEIFLKELRTAYQISESKTSISISSNISNRIDGIINAQENKASAANKQL